MQLPPIVADPTADSPQMLGPDNTYARQMILPGFGIHGQARLRQAHVVVVGAGALGCAALPILASTGVGHLTLIDPDTIASSNLARQLLYGPKDVSHKKVAVAADRLRSMAPEITLSVVAEPFSPRHLDGVDVVLDATDRVDSRYQIHDAARERSIPDVFGAALGFDGQWTVFHHAEPINGTDHSSDAEQANSAGQVDVAIRQVLPEHPGAPLGTCESEGIWTPVTQIVGAAMADQALRLVTGMPGVALGTLHLYSSSEGRFDAIPLRSR